MAVCITVQEASRALRDNGAAVEYTDAAMIATAGRGGQFKLRREIPYADRIGSLVDKETAFAAVRAFTRKDQRS